MVMLVFDLPSFPYVFKLIKDFYPAQKDTTREQVKAKYMLVKQHDRVGRMADTLEYSEVAFPRDRFSDELIAEIEKFAPSQLEISDRDGDGQTEVIIKHLYIERRMIPLNIYLQEALDAGPGDAHASQQICCYILCQIGIVHLQALGKGITCCQGGQLGPVIIPLCRLCIKGYTGILLRIQIQGCLCTFISGLVAPPGECHGYISGRCTSAVVSSRGCGITAVGGSGSCGFIGRTTCSQSDDHGGCH
jgi:hypothetical protein